ncbi:MAG: ABC transporter permease subunit [Ilumatobacter sp.]|uniref:ABC transporter permease n=1 Tax=Ilumatobacter sp. TaxID=1967498 RepID=UPI00260231F3|nr:ABC transporter permease subunit [Ilumatobacter sp.]MDJ0767654.1 ABC transporter permease subunit [Ilumatobacter sp.]
MDRDRRRLNRLPRWFVTAVAAPPVVFLAVFYAWPFLTLTARGVSIDAISDTLGNSRTWEVVWFTFWQAVASTMLTLLAGLAPAWAVSRFSFPGRRVLLSVLTAVFVLPTVIVGAAFVALLPSSLDRSVWAIIGAHVVFNLAVVVRTVGSVWERLPHDLDHAAATLGANRWATFRHVSLPLIRPALAAAAAIVFLFTFTSFGVIRVLGTPGRTTIEVEVWRRATQLGDIGGAAVLTLLQLLALGAMAAGAAAVQRRTAHVVDLREPSRHPRPSGRQWWTVGAALGLAVVMVAAPLVALVERSFRIGGAYSTDAWRGLGSNEIRPGLRLGVDPGDALLASVTNAAWATAFATAIGTAAVVAITVLGRSGRAIDTGLMLPLGTSAVTIGFGMLITFDTPPVDWRASWWLVPVGHALVAVPFVVRGALAVARSIDPDLRAAAATLGAPPIRAWATATLPMLRRPLATGGGIAAAISLGEFGATSFLSRSGEETLPIVIERLLARTGGVFQAQAFALATLLAAATVAIVVLVDAGGDRARRS